MISLHFQLLIVVAAVLILDSFQYTFAHSEELYSDQAISVFKDRSDTDERDNVLSEIGLATEDRLTYGFPALKANWKTNDTLVDPGRTRREVDKPIKELLDHGVGLGILRDPRNDDDDDGTGFIGGWATYFTQNQIAGACGKVHQDTDVIVALDYRRYGALNKISKYCGKKVRITSGDKTIVATVADACPTCLNRNSLDLSQGAFRKLGVTVEEGIKPITWKFVD